MCVYGCYSTILQLDYACDITFYAHSCRPTQFWKHRQYNKRPTRPTAVTFVRYYPGWYCFSGNHNKGRSTVLTLILMPNRCRWLQPFGFGWVFCSRAVQTIRRSQRFKSMIMLLWHERRSFQSHRKRHQAKNDGSSLSSSSNKTTNHKSPGHSLDGPSEWYAPKKTYKLFTLCVSVFVGHS